MSGAEPPGKCRKRPRGVLYLQGSDAVRPTVFPRRRRKPAPSAPLAEEGAAVAGPDEALRRAAESQMRRLLPDDEERPAEKAKLGEGGEEDEFEEIGRFDYSSANDLGSPGIQGLMVTSNFRRERSATREARTLLVRHLRDPPAITADAADAAPPAADAAAAATSTPVADSPPSAPLLSIVKLGARGVTVFKVAAAEGAAFVAAARRAEHAALAVLRDVESGAVPRLTHAQRIVPLHTTCALEADALTAAGARLAELAAPALKDAAAAGPPTFGVSFKGRTSGNEGAAAAGSSAQTSTPLDRKAAIAAVAAGFESALKERYGVDGLAVDLNSPSVVVCVEVLPVMGRLYAGLAVLPMAVCAPKKLVLRSVGDGVDGAAQKRGAKGQAKSDQPGGTGADQS